MDNIILDTDSYKASHFLQYPPGAEGMFSYVESRGGHYAYTLFFGLQYILKTVLTRRITREMVEEAAAFFPAHNEPFPYAGWQHIVERGGRLPVRIRAVPEGSVVPTHNVLMTVESTDPRVFWVVGWLETLLMRVWYPTTVATRSFFIKQIILDALASSADDPMAEIDFKLHDFGARGVSTRESAMVGGAAHLVNFKGSDTVAGIWMAQRYYQATEMPAFSLPAAEHSTITSWGRHREVDIYRTMLKLFAKPGALVAIVSDSYDLDNAVSNLWGGELRQMVIDSGATVIIRPDSGHPPTVVRRTLEQLDARFGHTLTSKGYRVLNHVRVVQGDGINEDSIAEILSVAMAAGYSATNVAFGMGGALLQQVNRDTQQFAMKLSEITIDGQRIPVSKTPVTDPGKHSKAGRLDLIRTPSGYQTVATTNGQPHPDSVMLTVFENGELLVDWSLAEIRARAAQARLAHHLQ